MNRRILMAGVATLAGTRSVAAQDAVSTPREMLLVYIDEVLRDGNLNALVRYFDPNVFDLDQVRKIHADLLDFTGGTSRVILAFGDWRSAIAQVSFLDGDGYGDVFVSIQVQDGMFWDHQILAGVRG